jgi:hypothetical protein
MARLSHKPMTRSWKCVTRRTMRKSTPSARRLEDSDGYLFGAARCIAHVSRVRCVCRRVSGRKSTRSYSEHQRWRMRINTGRKRPTCRRRNSCLACASSRGAGSYLTSSALFARNCSCAATMCESNAASNCRHTGRVALIAVDGCETIAGLPRHSIYERAFVKRGWC